MQINNLPAGIDNSTVNSWINTFDLHLHTFLQNEYDNRFRYKLDSQYTLEFSDELIEESVGNISLEEAKDIILKNWPLKPSKYVNEKHIRDLTDRIKKIETLEGLEGCISAIAEMYVDENGESNYQQTRSQIEEVLNRTVNVGDAYKLYTLGRYYDSTKTIVLYKRAINMSKRTTPLELFEEVFAHEAFHAYHYYICKEKNLTNFIDIERRKDYTSKVVKESLAAFFEYYYCRQNNIVTDINIDWTSNNINTYPYSGAKYLLPFSYNASPIFIDVLKASYFDFDQALRMLLANNMTDFYLVKNHKEVETIVINKPQSQQGTINITFPIDDLEIYDWLKGMGTGWFILKYAEDHGIPSPIPLTYGTPNAMATRKYVYNKTKPYHSDILKYLKRKGLSFQVHAGEGNQRVNVREIQRILDMLN